MIKIYEVKYSYLGQVNYVQITAESAAAALAIASDSLPEALWLDVYRSPEADYVK